MSVSNRKRGGFTLVEILIVVVILGILAAIVIPQFTNASQSAMGSSVLSQLQTTRSQLALYQVQHNGTYPPALWGLLLVATNADGTTSGTPQFGPYMPTAPINPFNNTSVVAGVGSQAATNGWVYTPATGTVYASVNSTLAGLLSMTTNDVATS